MQRSPSSDPGTTAPLLRAGAVVGGKYRLDHELGRGGMGVVMSARNLQTGGEVALKFVRCEGLVTSQQAERMLREARAAARLEGEHVARILDVGALHDGSPFLVLERLRGRDLSAELASEGPLPVERSVDWALQIAEALAEAHRMGIVHRDLKPSNLFVTRRADGSATLKLLDFGISRVLVSDEEKTLTGEGIMGTPPYLSPEQIRDPHSVDARADLWSLGVVLFEMLTGQRPFVASQPSGLLAAVVADEPRSLAELLPDAPPSLVSAVARCLEKSPRARFGSARELALSLEPLASAEGKAACRRLVASPASALASVDAPGEGVSTLTSLSTATSPAAPPSFPAFPRAGELATPLELSSAVPARRRPRRKGGPFALAALSLFALVVGSFALLRRPAGGPGREGPSAAASAPAAELSTRALSTPALSTPALSTPALSTPALSTPALSGPAPSALPPAAPASPASSAARPRPSPAGPTRPSRVRRDDDDRSW